MNTKKLQEKINSVAKSGNAKTISIILLLAVIVTGYIFFFNSTKIVGESFDFEVTEIGKTITLEKGHTIKLVRADIDKENNLIEFEFYFQNSNFDGCNNYDITIKSATKKGNISQLKPITACADSDVYVVRAELPKSWYAVVADITLKNADDKRLEAKFYETDETLYKTTILSETSREYFLKLDTERNIESLQNDIISISETNSKLQDKITAIDENISNIQSRFNYMTADELADAEKQITRLTNEKKSLLAEIDDNNKTIKEYKDNIIDLQNKLNGG